MLLSLLLLFSVVSPSNSYSLPGLNLDSNSHYGWDVSTSGRYALVGVHEGDQAFMFYLNESINTWQLHEVFTSGGISTQFGNSVSVSTSNISVIGSPSEQTVYFYRWNGTQWPALTKVQTNKSNFGINVHVNKERAIVGSMGEMAFIYGNIIDDPLEWTIQNVTASIEQSDQSFGCSVHMDGYYAIVGAKQYSNEYTQQGAAYIFRLSGGEWNEIQQIVSPEPIENGRLGSYVVIHEDFVVACQQHISYVFRKNESTDQWDYTWKFQGSRADLKKKYGNEYLFVSNDKSVEIYILIDYEWVSLKKYSYENNELRVSVDDFVLIGSPYEGYGKAYIEDYLFLCNGSVHGCGDISQGFCEEENVCKCKAGFKGNEPLNCNGYSCESVSDCNGKGDCIGPNNCSCFFDWFGEECNVCYCNGINSTDENVCNGNGNCTSPDKCSCDYGYKGFEPFNCSKYSCENENECSGKGECVGPNTCKCNFGWFGDSCNVFGCKNISSYDKTVCSSHGSCVSLDKCDCDSGYKGNEPTYCDVFSCEQKDECNGHGDCISPNLCQCNDFWFGERCDIPSCDGIPANNRSSCNLRGICIDFNVCECSEGFDKDTFCKDFSCFGIVSNDSSVCSSHGVCEYGNVCNCSEGFSGEECDEWSCYGVKNTHEDVCNSHGICLDNFTCLCDSNYSSTSNCQGWTCNGLKESSLDVCNGNGLCMDIDLCMCIEGYSGKWCEYWECNNTNFSSSQACFGRGECFKPDSCDCNDGYEGKNCETFRCGNYYFNESKTCEGRGSCISPNNCKCIPGYGGNLCETNMGVIYTLVSTISITSLIVFLGVIIVPIVIVFLLYASRKQKKKLKKFEQIDGIDIIAEEYEMSQKSGVQFKVNQSLFQIDFGKIKIIREIGRGGGLELLIFANSKEEN